MKTAVTPGTRRRGRHRAPGTGRGWGPRALLSAMAAPLGVVAGVSAAVAGALVDQVVVAGVGTALAGVPGLLHLTRSRAREQRLAARRARALSAPIPPLVWESVVDTVPEPEPMPEPQPAPEPLPSPEPMPSPDPSPAPEPGPVPDPVPDPGPMPDSTGRPDQPVVDLRDERVDTGELQRIWDLGEGPDTGPLPVIPDVPVVTEGRLVTEAPLGKQAVLAQGLAGTTQVLAPVLARRQRQRVADDEVLDAMVRAESQEQARREQDHREQDHREQAARRRGRRAAAGPVDRPPLALTTGTGGGRRAARPAADAAQGRHPVV